MAERDDWAEEGWDFDIRFAVFCGLATYAWHAWQGEYALGATAGLSLIVLGPPMFRLKRRLRRYTYRWAEPAAAWARAHPRQSRRLRWVVFPLVAAVWLLVLGALFTPLLD